ncbi:thioredoxin family protein [Agromyces sp. LHK192]|uniref:TlpA family protein disulfide reductase n=1 Tax=Agromyces sp. LHK192 TaxID=2498704 RepID=UPI000FD7517F|nr:thioredoxin family protein [Agromyces sp. LHK192]
MDWSTAAGAAIALVALTSVAGVALRARDGRLRATASRPDASATAADALGLTRGALGSAATLVQFSTEFCSRCPGVARRLDALAAEHTGVRHVEIDLTADARLADRFDVLQTPTTLVLDATGTEIARIGGVPRDGELVPLVERLATTSPDGSRHASA